jgi:putative ATP-dependent endonuclease of the OLD family
MNGRTDAMQQSLEEISQTDPVTGKSSITLNVRCAWNEPDGCFQPGWAFLNAARQPLIGGSARRVNLERFWQYVPVLGIGEQRNRKLAQGFRRPRPSNRTG